MVENNKNINTLRIVLIGHSGVGKTNIISRFISGHYNPSSPKNTGSYVQKTIKIGNKTIQLDIFDCLLERAYLLQFKLFAKDANGIILVYDITCECHLEELQDYWYSTIKPNIQKEGSKKIIIFNYN